jgi:hypothetical protein
LTSVADRHLDERIAEEGNDAPEFRMRRQLDPVRANFRLNLRSGSSRTR